MFYSARVAPSSTQQPRKTLVFSELNLKVNEVLILCSKVGGNWTVGKHDGYYGAYHLHNPPGWKSCVFKHKTIKIDVVGERHAAKYIQIA